MRHSCSTLLPNSLTAEGTPAIPIGTEVSETGTKRSKEFRLRFQRL